MTLYPCTPKQVLWQFAFRGASECKVRNLIYIERTGHFAIHVGWLLALTYLLYTVLMNSKKGETAVHHCDPALSVLTIYSVSQKVFHLVSALSVLADQISCTSPTLASFIACGPSLLQFLISRRINSMLFDPRGIL